MTNGHVDPFFGRDGFTPLGAPLQSTFKSFWPLAIYNNPSSLVVTEMRLSRREVYLIPPSGGQPALPVWQDDRNDMTATIIGVNLSDELVAFVKPRQDLHWNGLRRYTNVGTRKMSYEDVDFRLDSADHDFKDELRYCVDRMGRLLVIRNRGERLVGTRYNKDGTLDETYGNAMGRVVMPRTQEEYGC